MYIIIILIVISIAFAIAYIKTLDFKDDTQFFYQQSNDNISAFAYINPPISDEQYLSSSSPSPTTTISTTPGPGTISTTPGTISTTSTPSMPTTNNPDADAAVVAINKFRATFNLPPMKYDTSKNADADACAAYDAQNGYHSSMKAGKAPGAAAQCECNGIMGARCVQFYQDEQSNVQNPTSANPTCGSKSCGHWCIILGSFTSVASGTSGRFSTQNFYNGRPRCSF